MKFLGIIPARYASTRFPGKPLADLGGKPMIQRVYEQCKIALKEVVVATDDIRIKEAVKAFGGNVVMTSPDHQSGTDRCAEAAKKMSDSLIFDVAINIQGDEPFIQTEQIEQIKGCFDTPDAEIATLVLPVSNTDDLFDPNKPKVVINNKSEAIYFSRSPIPYLRGKDEKDWLNNHSYYRHIGMYAYRKEILFELTKLKQTPLELAESLEQLRWIENGYSIKTAVTNHESVGIDTPEDLQRVLNEGLL